MRSKPASAADIRLPKHSPFGPLPDPTPVRKQTMTRSMVSQIEKGALDKLAAALKERGFTASDFL